MPIPRSILTKGDLPDLDLRVVRGAWPSDISGHLVISTSDQRTHPVHAFFGDGVMVRLALEPGTDGAAPDRFAWRPRVIDTPSVRLRRRRPEVFTATRLGTTSPFGTLNAANTAPLPWGDRLFATWDAGRPVEIDPVTLAFVAEVGHRDDWAPALDAPVLPLIATTAHPVIDPERGCLWSVTRDVFSGELSVVRYDGSGRHVRRWRVEGVSFPQATHTITQTRDWLVLADTAYKVDLADDRTVTNNPDGPLVLVRKDDLESAGDGGAVRGSVFRLAPEVNHFYAAYDDSAGIRVVMEHTPGVDIGMYLREDDVDAFGRPIDPALRGMYCHGMSPALTTVLEFDPVKGTVTDVARLYDPSRYWQGRAVCHGLVLRRSARAHAPPPRLPGLPPRGDQPAGAAELRGQGRPFALPSRGDALRARLAGARLAQAAVGVGVDAGGLPDLARVRAAGTRRPRQVAVRGPRPRRAQRVPGRRRPP
ncbi:carotenoid oxygenase family protein [Nonomuraea dietziae]|uniref:carotenoid oxygenase family protein n=1 Tax=Nonomuraea dietziae TaxID=65515 RepID=UPI0031D08909